MKIGRGIGLFASVIVVIVGVIAAAYLAWVHGGDDWQFVEQVILEDVDGQPLHGVIRWTRSPTIAVDGAGNVDLETIRRVVASIDQAIGESGVSVDIDIGVDVEHDILIRFTPLETFPDIARELGAAYREGNVGYYWTWGTDSFALERVVVVIASDLTGRRRETALVHELAHAVGLFGHTSVFRASAVYQTPDSTTSATSLASVDRKLLRFLYTNLAPGDGWKEVRSAFEVHWRD